MVLVDQEIGPYIVNTVDESLNGSDIYSEVVPNMHVENLSSHKNTNIV